MIGQATAVARFLWPDFVEQHGCVFLGNEPGFSPPPANGRATDWECFINHTHIFDEFRNKATRTVVLDEHEEANFIEEIYDETHPDFIAACELGRMAARLWTLKLKQDFPADRFRVYYTEYDNPIVRFHKVRANEPLWLTDEHLRTAFQPGFRNALIYDTENPEKPTSAPPIIVQ